MHELQLCPTVVPTDPDVRIHDRFVYGFRFFVTMFMGFVTATLFIRTEFSADSVANGNLYFGEHRICAP